MTGLITTLGLLDSSELGLILPHEHIFVDLRTWDKPGYAQAEVEDVVRLMVPELTRAKEAGVTAVVECTPVGAGRRVDILRAVSEAAGFPVLVPTGIYRDAWIPDWARAASQAELTAWMLGELHGEIEGSGVQAAWIKLGASDDGLTACETKILQAAAIAGRETNAVIGSHTVRGRVAREQLNVVEAMGYSAERFIWIHTQDEPDFEIHLELAKRGAWLEYDSIGCGDATENDGFHIRLIQRILDAGLGDHLLLSHDRGWYDPAQPGGGVPRPFTYLSNQFLPKLRSAGVDEATILQLTQANPYRAFAR
jgi:phosphotriesterase-related protein